MKYQCVLTILILTLHIVQVSAQDKFGKTNDVNGGEHKRRNALVSVSTLDEVYEFDRVDLNGSHDSTVQVTSTDSAIDHPTTMTRQAGRLYITTTPQAAIIFVNDSLIGVTPRECEFCAGPCRLTLSLVNYEPYEKNYTISPCLNDTLKVVFKPALQSGRVRHFNIATQKNIGRLSLGSLGIVSAVASVVLFSKAVECHDHMAQTSEIGEVSKYERIKDDYNSYKTLGLTFFGLGLLSSTGFAITFIL